MPKLKVYLSASFAADRVLVARVKDKLLEKDVEILTYTGSGWTQRDEDKLKSADVVVIVPHKRFPHCFTLGAGQYNEIRKFYNTTKGGYKTIAVVYSIYSDIEANVDSIVTFSSCVQVDDSSRNMVDNYCSVSGLKQSGLSQFIDMNKALSEAKAPSHNTKPSKSAPKEMSDLPQEVIDAIAEAHAGSMLLGTCRAGIGMVDQFAEHKQVQALREEWEKVNSARINSLRFSSPKPDDSAWEMKMAATAISEPIDIDEESGYQESLIPMLALYPVICKG